MSLYKPTSVTLSFGFKEIIMQQVTKLSYYCIKVELPKTDLPRSNHAVSTVSQNYYNRQIQLNLA